MPRHVQISAALIRRGEAVLLVCQQGPDDPCPTWSLPGGIVEPGELPTDAMIREVREETGLTVHAPGQLLYVNSGVSRTDGSSSTVFVFAVEAWSGATAIADPDGLVSEASFFPLQEAIGHLHRLPRRDMREPIIAYLNGTTRMGALWLYHFDMRGAPIGVLPIQWTVAKVNSSAFRICAASNSIGGR